MATKKVTCRCGGCGSAKEVTVEARRETKAPICCGQTMKKVSNK